MKKRILPLFAAVLLMAQGTLAGPGHGGRMIEKMADKLGLSEEQTTRVKAVFEEKRANREGKQTARQEVDALLVAGNTQAAADLAAEHARQRVLERAEFYSKLQAILTEEQFAAWQEMKQARGKKRHHRY